MKRRLSSTRRVSRPVVASEVSRKIGDVVVADFSLSRARHDADARSDDMLDISAGKIGSLFQGCGFCAFVALLERIGAGEDAGRKFAAVGGGCLPHRVW